MAEFFLDTYEHAVHYAWRYRALNDRDTFENIGALAKPFLFAAEGLRNSDWSKDPESRQAVVEAIDQVIAEFEAAIEGRALLSPEVTSEQSRG